VRRGLSSRTQHRTVEYPAVLLDHTAATELWSDRAHGRLHHLEPPGGELSSASERTLLALYQVGDGTLSNPHELLGAVPKSLGAMHIVHVERDAYLVGWFVRRPCEDGASPQNVGGPARCLRGSTMNPMAARSECAGGCEQWSANVSSVHGQLLASTLAVHSRPPSSAVKWAVEVGFDGVEILCDPPWHPSGWSPSECKAVAAAGVSVSLHAPVADVSLMSPHPTVRRFAEREILRTTELARRVGAFSVTFHLGGRPTMGAPHEPPWEEARRAVRRLVDGAADRGVALALENDPRIPGLYLWDLDEFARWLCELDIPAVLDVGHAWTAHGVESISRMAALLPWTAGVHLHDNHGSVDAHLPLGEGTLSLERIWPLVCDVQFVALEAATPEGLRSSLNALRRLSTAEP